VSRLAILTAAACPPLHAQESRVVVDSAYAPEVAAPAFPEGGGPRVLLDLAHFNLYTNEGYYRPLRALLKADGYRVGSSTAPLSLATLAQADLVVVANALPAPDQVAADTLGPGLSDEEVRALLAWVAGGGGLLLLIDHRPYPRAAAPLLEALGLGFTNGYALDYRAWDPVVFRRSDGTLPASPIADGRGPAERVDSVATFYGDALRADGRGVIPLLRFGPTVDAFLPERQWDIGDRTPSVHVAGWLQGAALTRGRGRVVVLGESGMAAAQLVGPKRNPQGMNAPVAAQNSVFLLNAAHWLTHVIP
jgi:hypothetical protein